MNSFPVLNFFKDCLGFILFVVFFFLWHGTRLWPKIFLSLVLAFAVIIIAADYIVKS